MLESDFQANLTKDLKELLPGCIILKGNSASRQGIPDWIIFYNEQWAALEVKRSETAKRQPNQPYYVEKMNHMSYAAFVHPGNREEILDEICAHFGVRQTS